MMLSSTITATARRGCCSSIKGLTSSSSTPSITSISSISIASSKRLLYQTSSSSSSRRYLSNKAKAEAKAKAKATITPRKNVPASERAALRQSRKQRAAIPPQNSTHPSAAQSSTSSSSTGAAAAAGVGVGGTPKDPRLVFGLALGIPTLLITWGVVDANSPPAKLATLLGFDEFAESFARPNEEKLLPNWHDMKDVPKDFQPMTLVIDLEDTLVNSSWDRKKGWRTAKRPGAIKFIRELAQYYEIVLYSPSNMGVAFPIVEALQMESGGGIMHTLFREACYYKDGVYMKDLSRLNRNTSRVILIDDDERAAELNPENLIRVKPYSDPKDRKDQTLERLIPFLIEIATENYRDARVVLGQFQGMDADEIADEMERRVSRLQDIRNEGGGLASWSSARKMKLPEPEMAPVDRSRAKSMGGISSKDIVGEGPSSGKSMSKGLSGWLQNRQEKQAKERQEKMEHWSQLMMERNAEKSQQQQDA